ncbi:hypothetical protein Tco_1483839 [Tanacetum coccineum]
MKQLNITEKGVGGDTTIKKFGHCSSGNDADSDIRPSNDSDTILEVHHDMFENMFVHGIQNHEQPKSIPNTYVVNENNYNVISDIPNMDPDKGKEEHDDVNREAQQMNALLTNKLERYKEKEKYFAKETTIEFEYCTKIKLLNDEISNLKSQAFQNDKAFARENGKFDELQKSGQTNQTLRMLLPKEDNINTGKHGLGFENKNNVENLNLLNKAKEFAPCLYNIDEMGKESLSDHKIIFEGELKCEAEKFKDVNLQLNYFEKGLVKEMKDDLKYIMSLKDEFDETWEKKILFGNETSSFETKIKELEMTLAQQTKNFEDAKDDFSKKSDKFETYFEKLENTRVFLERQLDRKIQDSKAEKEQFLKQIAALESKLASQDLLSIQREYSDLRTSYNALKAKFHSLNRTKENLQAQTFKNQHSKWSTCMATVVQEDGTTRKKTYAKLSATEKLQADCDCKATNIVLHFLPPDVYTIVNHHKVANEIWDRVKLLMQGMKLSLQEKECKLYDKFDKFSLVKGDDPSACLNKAMAFLTAIASLRPRNAAWFKKKAMLAEAQEAGQSLDEEQLAFLADLGIPDDQASQTTIPNTAAFQIEDLDAYDSDCDDVFNAKAILMANLSNYGSDIILESFEQTPVVNFTDNEITSDSNIISYSQYLQETQQAAVQDNNLYAQQDSMILSVIEQMSKQMINHVNNWETTYQEKNNESLTVELERYKERVKTFEQRLNIDLSIREKMIDSQVDDMIKGKLALKQQIDSLEQNLSNQIKET